MSLQAGQLQLSPSEQFPHVWGVFMENLIGGTPVTLVVFAEGSVSLYLGNGGGIIGGGGHEPVRAAGFQFLAVAERLIDSFAQGDDRALPSGDEVRFHLRTFE